MPRSTRARPGCLICKARKVKCDSPTGQCTQCTKMRLSCPGTASETTSNAKTTPPNEEEISKIVSETFHRAGRKRRLVGACKACQASKIRCSRERPCSRCVDRGINCVYSSGRHSTRERGGLSMPPAVNRNGDLEICQRGFEREHGSQELCCRGTSSSILLEREGEVGSVLSQDQLGNAENGRVRFLCEAYFDHVHPLRCLSFIHKPSFMQALDSGRAVVEFGEALVCIMCAFGERFSVISSREVHLTGITRPGIGWAERAQELAFSDLGRPSLSNLMALVLLSEWHIRFGQESTAFMTSGISSRLAQLLRLESEPTEESLDGIPSSLITAEKESRRRLVWSCYVLDVTISSGVDLISNWPSVPRTRLPCSAREFTLQLECETGSLCEEYGFLDSLRKYNMCLEAYFVRIIYLRKQVLRLTRILVASRLIRQDSSTTLSDFDQLVSHLEACGDSFPSHLQLNEINAYVHEENKQLAAFYALHLLYNQCFCDLYRITLPGYRFPLSDVITREQPDRVQDLRKQCVQRAKSITSILRSALARGTKGLTDSICSICAYESAKIQVIYARTCEDVVNGDVRESIRTNLEALDVIFGWDKKRDVLLSSLSRLLREFGFSGLAKVWLDRNNSSFSCDNEDVTPDSHHLHALALYRMSWKEISWPGKPDTNSRMQRSQPETLVSMGIESSNEVAEPQCLANMTDSTLVNSTNLELPTADTMTNIDSYLQMADEFSNHLTWDPWDFGYAELLPT